MRRFGEDAGHKQWPKGILDKICLLVIVFLLCSLTYAIFSSPMVFGQPPASKEGLVGRGRIVAQERFAPGEILVKFKAGTPAARINGINARIGARAIKKFRITKIHHLGLPANVKVKDAVKAYSLYPEVAYAEPNYMVHILDFFPVDPDFANQWGLHNTGQTGGTSDADIDAPAAWDISTGSGAIVVAVIDTGVDYDHEDLADNMWTNPGEIPDNGEDDDGNGYIDDVYGYDFCNDDGDPDDDAGHGTHCAGIIGAVTDNEIGIAGVCHDVKIMALKFLDSEGSGSTSDAISCIEYAIAQGADLTSNSWGGGGYSQALRDAISASNTAGMLFIAAAGNDGDNTDSAPHYPSSYDLPNIISVAATDHNDQLAEVPTWGWGSNWGTRTVDIGAPGVSIYSTLPGDAYDYMSGTSMACPYVSGAAALTWAVYPGLSNSQVKLRLLATGDPIPALASKVLSERRLNINTCLRATPASVNVNIAFPRDNFSALREDTVPVVAFATDNAGGVLSSSTLTATFSNGDPSITLYDDGAHNDEVAGDGIYAGTWEPGALGPTDITIVATEPGLTTGQDTNSGNVTRLFDYAYDDTVPFAWINATTGTNTGIAGDDVYAEIPIGFDFEFYGNIYSSVRVSSNGYLTFGADGTDYSNDSIPDPWDPNDLIAPLWDDLDPSVIGAEVYYLLEGTAPNRRLTVEWYQIPHWPYDSGVVTFEVTLYETTNEMKFQYLDVDFDDSSYDYGASATVGIEGPTGVQGLQYSYNTAVLSDGLAIRIYPTSLWGTLIESYPNEQAPGGKWYNWQGYEFTLDQSSDIYIQLTAQAWSGQQNPSGDDDDLIVKLDGQWLNSWNAPDSIDGWPQWGRKRTINLTKTGLSAGKHILRLYADEKPKLYSLIVSTQPISVALSTYPNEQAPGGNWYQWQGYEFTLEETSDIYIQLTGQAWSGQQNPSGGDDDLIVNLDGQWLNSWNAPDSIDGWPQWGRKRTINLTKTGVAPGKHILRLYADEKPKLYSLIVSTQPISVALSTYPNEQAPGGNWYQWQGYEFTLEETSDIYIQLTGQAWSGSQNPSGGDDDLIVNLDGQWLNSWNAPDSIDGWSQWGRKRTINLTKTGVAPGKHILRLYADEKPKLYSLVVHPEYGYDDTVPFAWIDATTGTPLGIVDEDYRQIPIGFDFEFYGNTYSSVKVTDNGYLTFGSSATGYWVNGPIPSPSEPNDLIAPLWDDYDPSDYWSPDAEVYYLLEGTAPNRRLTIEWYHVLHWAFLSDDGVTFEVTLYETTNKMKFQYLDVNFDDFFYDYGASATVGVENETGTQGLQYSYNTAVLSDGLAIRIYATALWETLIESYPNEQAPGGKWYNWQGYEFTLEETSDIYIQLTAQAWSGQQNPSGDDDDLIVNLDGQWLNSWNDPDSIDGWPQWGRKRTINLTKTGLSAGKHILRLWADEKPVLYSLKVIKVSP